MPGVGRDVPNMVDGVRKEDDVDRLSIQRRIVWLTENRVDLDQALRLRFSADVLYPLLDDVQGVDHAFRPNSPGELVAPEPILATDVHDMVCELQIDQIQHLLSIGVLAKPIAERVPRVVVEIRHAHAVAGVGQPVVVAV